MKRGPMENELTESVIDASAMSPAVWIKPLCSASIGTLTYIYTVTLIFPSELNGKKI